MGPIGINKRMPVTQWLHATSEIASIVAGPKNQHSILKINMQVTIRDQALEDMSEEDRVACLRLNGKVAEEIKAEKVMKCGRKR